MCAKCIKVALNFLTSLEQFKSLQFTGSLQTQVGGEQEEEDGHSLSFYLLIKDALLAWVFGE